MKKSKKVAALLLGATLALSSLTACGGMGGGKVSSEATEIVVKCRRAGFGTDWLYELKSRFEAAYSAQGYKVKILEPDNSIKDDTVIKEMALGYNNVGVDLYITSGAMPDKVGALGDYGILVEDLGELVYDKPAIAYDGTEEEKLVSEKVSQDTLDYMTDSNGIRYAYCWAQTSGGLVVNTRKLAQYDLEIPKTTNEMFDCFDKIYCGTNGIKGSIYSGTYPITYISGSNGYALVFLYTLLAQYDIDFFNKYWSFQTTDESGAVTNLSDAECQALYDDPTLLHMMEIAYRAFDMKISAPGSLSQTVDQAQAKVMGDIDGAVFMFNGDWMLNEVKLNYRNRLNDIDFCNFPVLSAVGTKVFGEGTAYGFDDAKCEELLSYIIGLVDENKELDEIIAAVKANKGVDIAEADAREVARARGVTYSRGVEHVAYITKDSAKKDIAALFLRMMASDDYGETFNRTANGTSPYAAQENTTSEYEFVRNASKLPANKYFSLVSLSTGARGYRKQLNLTGMFSTQSHVPDYISANSSASIYSEECTHNGNSLSVYTDAAEKFLKAEKENILKNWERYKETAGIKN